MRKDESLNKLRKLISLIWVKQALRVAIGTSFEISFVRRPRGDRRIILKWTSVKWGTRTGLDLKSSLWDPMTSFCEHDS
jgi:hypothetical protein